MGLVTSGGYIKYLCALFTLFCQSWTKRRARLPPAQVSTPCASQWGEVAIWTFTNYINFDFLIFLAFHLSSTETTQIKNAMLPGLPRQDLDPHQLPRQDGRECLHWICTIQHSTVEQALKNWENFYKVRGGALKTEEKTGIWGSSIWSRGCLYTHRQSHMRQEVRLFTM